MYDLQTLIYLEEFIDKRIKKAKMKLETKGKISNQYIIYKNILLELKWIKDYINRKK